MGRGNFRAPGDHYGRLNHTMYVSTIGWGAKDEFVVRESDLFETLEHNLPKSFQVTERYGKDGERTYFVFAENEKCELVVESCDNYYAVAFVAKSRLKAGWCIGWQKTAKKVFRNLFYSGFELLYSTGPWTSSVWSPKGFTHLGKHYGPDDKIKNGGGYNEWVSAGS